MTSDTPVLLYLDQSYWGRLALEENRELVSWIEGHVQTGRLVVPFSMFVFTETVKARLDIKKALLPIFKRLSRSKGLINYVDFLRMEYQRYREDRSVEWIRERLLASSVPQMAGPVEGLPPGPTVPLADYLDGVLSEPVSRDTAQELSEHLQQGAAEANALPPGNELPTEFSRTELANIMSVAEDSIAEEFVQVFEVFPSFRVLDKVQRQIRDRKKDGVVRNDIVDLTFIAQTVPYFDVVTVDRAMGARIREADLGNDIYGEVVARIDELQPTIERAFSKSVS